MPSLSAGGAVVTRSLTIGQALAALAQEIDPELCRVLAADGEDLQRLFVPSMYDWSPHAGALRLDERKRRLLAELVRRLQDGTWQLIWLPDVATQGAKPFDAEQLPELVSGKSLDAEQSEVILGGTRYRVRVITERTAPPQSTGRATAPAAADDDEATPEAQLQARYDARVTEKRVPTIEEDRAWAKQQGIRQKQLEKLRDNNPDPRLHIRGRRRR